MNKIDRIRTQLATLHPLSLEIIDDSAKHLGHGGYRDDGSHYQVHIISPLFEGQNTVTRHRMIYAALADMMKQDIHALNIEAFSPSERPAVR